MVNCVEFEVISTDIDVKEMVLAARASPENENDDMIRIRAMLPLRNHVYTSWDVTSWDVVLHRFQRLYCSGTTTLRIRFANAGGFLQIIN